MQWNLQAEESSSMFGPTLSVVDPNLINHLYSVAAHQFWFFKATREQDCEVLVSSSVPVDFDLQNPCPIPIHRVDRELGQDDQLWRVSGSGSHPRRLFILMEDISMTVLKDLAHLKPLESQHLDLPIQISARIPSNILSVEWKHLANQLLNNLGYVLFHLNHSHDGLTILMGRLFVQASQDALKPLKIIWDGRHLDWNSPWWGRPGLPWTAYCGIWFPRLPECEIVLWNDPNWNEHLNSANAIIRWPGYNLEELFQLSGLGYPPSAIIYLSVGESLPRQSGLFDEKKLDNIVLLEEPWQQKVREQNSGKNNVVLFGLVPKIYDQNHLWAWDSDLANFYVREGRFEEVPDFDDRIGPALCFISSHCNVPFRDSMVDSLRNAGIAIEGFGKCHHSPNPSIANRCKNDKRCIQKSYRFCLVSENSDSPGYHTEKIFDALRDGCIPVYWANVDAINFVPSEDSVILIRNFQNDIQALKSRIEEINGNPELWRSFLTWRKNPPDWFNIRGLSADLLPCYICQHLTSRIHF